MIFGGGREECGKMKNRRVHIHLRIAQQEQLVFHVDTILLWKEYALI